MSDDDRELTYLQRYGHEELPQPMKVGELPADFKREAWNTIWRFLKTDGGHFEYLQYDGLILHVIGNYRKIPENTVKNDREEIEADISSIFTRAAVHNVMHFIEILVNAPNLPTAVIAEISQLFETHRIAYRLDLSEEPYRIFERTSKEESDATLQSLEKINEHGFVAALSHLKQATEHIHAGQYPDAIHDSISAVESVARAITPEADSLRKALKELENSGMIKHGAFKAAIGQLYGYTSNEEGIRHPLIEGAEADVGLPEALFFYNACAAFAGYLATLGGAR